MLTKLTYPLEAITIAIKQTYLLAMFSVLMCSFLAINTAFVNGQVDTANSTSKIELAHTSFQKAFCAVLDAEKASADTTNLTNRLNSAASTLKDAEIAAQNGDYLISESKTAQVITNCNAIYLDAVTLSENAQIQQSNEFTVYALILIVGSIVMVCLLFIIWKHVKHNYVQEILYTKPMVL